MSAFTPQTNWVTPMSSKADQPKPTASTPFPAKAKASRASRPTTKPDDLAIVNDPIKDGRAEYGTKYESILAKLKPGQAIKCQTAEVGRVTAALRGHIRKKALKHHLVRSTRDYGDGMARVWLMVVKP